MRGVTGLKKVQEQLRTYGLLSLGSILRSWTKNMIADEVWRVTQSKEKEREALEERMMTRAHEAKSSLASQSALVEALRQENSSLRETNKERVLEVALLEKNLEKLVTTQADQSKVMESDAIQAIFKISETAVSRAHASALVVCCLRFFRTSRSNVISRGLSSWRRSVMSSSATLP